MIQYLMYRVLTGKHDSIIISFMISGHTMFSPNWCFGLLKMKYRHTNVGGLLDLVQVVNTSSVVNVAESIGSTEGEILVPTYDWQSFLGYFFNKLKGIKKFHHSRFESDSPGGVFVKEKIDSVKTELSLMKTSHEPLTTEMPQQLAPSGLSLQRQWYLYQKVQEFFRVLSKDAVKCR